MQQQQLCSVAYLQVWLLREWDRTTPAQGNETFRAHIGCTKKKKKVKENVCFVLSLNLINLQVVESLIDKRKLILKNRIEPLLYALTLTTKDKKQNSVKTGLQSSLCAKRRTSNESNKQSSLGSEPQPRRVDHPHISTSVWGHRRRLPSPLIGQMD